MLRRTRSKRMRGLAYRLPCEAPAPWVIASSSCRAGGMHLGKKLLGGHAERVHDARCVAARNQRSISHWEFLSRSGPDLDSCFTAIIAATQSPSYHARDCFAVASRWAALWSRPLAMTPPGVPLSRRLHRGPAPGTDPGRGAVAIRPAPSRDGARPGACPAFFRLGGEPVKAHRTSGRSKKVATTTRKPMLLFRLFGLFLLRTAQRTFLGLLL